LVACVCEIHSTGSIDSDVTRTVDVGRGGWSAVTAEAWDSISSDGGDDAGRSADLADPVVPGVGNEDVVGCVDSHTRRIANEGV
jgi:hypothetical protein